ncbi:AfsR/SARP family transcriptional regulator [Streptomyces celluloflavus]|uniref:AfsR/SARP family transcriptional regulator n=1 Tax=Streptomyces celluloflavus TaxID=58344 RepID=UPI0036823CA7
MRYDIWFSVLGAVRVRRGGKDLTAGPPQQQALLAALLLRAGRGASAHELIGAIWGEDAPGSALASLRTYAWRLRQMLEEDRAEPRLLVSLRDGYQLVVLPVSVDAHLAEKLAADAVQAREAGLDEECRRLLTQALELWRGEPLAGLPGPFAEQQRSRLGELRLALLEERFDSDLRLGRHSFVIPELAAFAEEYPLRERVYGFQMRALYACGRQADALAVFTRARRLLAEELGVDPGPELTALQAQVLAGEPLPPAPGRAPQRAPVHLAAPPGPAAPDEARPAQPALFRPAQLPADTADFIGRAHEMHEMCQVLTDAAGTAMPVVSITGMGGIGKTTLALRLAHQAKQHFVDGQLYADLGGNGLEPADPGIVLDSFLTALGVSGHTLPALLEDRARLFRSTLDGRHILLLLDNARDPAQVRPLLPGSADCAVVVTSRVRLTGLPTTLQTALDVFGTDDSLELLASTAGAQRVSDEPGAALELVTACGHLPLAVRIVAARLAARPQWQIATMVGRLADERRRIGELRAGDLAVAAAFELGYRQLAESQARAFRGLAPVAQPSISLACAAAALGLGEHEAEDLLEALVDAAMLEAPLPERYRFHDLVRSFALQLTTVPKDSGEDDAATLARLLGHLLAGGCSAFQHMVPGDPAEVILTASSVPGPRFPGLSEAQDWVSTEFDCIVNAVLVAARGPAPVPARTLRMAADLLVALSPFGKSIPYGRLAEAAREVAEVAAAQGDDYTTGRARFVCGNAALQNARLDEAARHTALASKACHRADDRVILQQTLNDRGLIAQFQQRYGDAVRCYEQAIGLARELGHRSGELTATLNAAQARLRSGGAEEAARICEQALGALRGVAEQHCTAYALFVHGQALHELKSHAAAVARYRECLDVCVAAGIRGQEAQARFRLAETLRVLGRFDEARAEAERSLVMCEERGAEHDRGYALLILARVLAGLGDARGALTRARQADAVFAGLGLPDVREARDLAGRLTAVAHG